MMGGLRGWSGRSEENKNLLYLPRFETRTVQSIT